MKRVIIKQTDFTSEVKNNAKKIQNIIDENNDGVEIVFEKGEYVLSTVFMKDNTHIVINKDAKILGGESFYDFEPEEKYDFPLYQDSSHSNFNCSLFVAKNAKNVSITGEGVIDMRSVWDEDGVRGEAIKHRGPKCITLKECQNVILSGITLLNVTDLAIYFTACKNVDIHGISMRVYIDGISPDNSKDVKIYDCNIEAGDDGIVFKSSYNLNRLGKCENISVWNCKIKSRCNAVKFGTETNGGFENIEIKNCYLFDTRICGIAVESVDGAIIDNITFKDIEMVNVGTPFFVHLGRRMRGPKGLEIGEIKNIVFENITAKGPYEAYDIVPWNYFSFKANDTRQLPQVFGNAEGFNGNLYTEDWQITSNVCGLNGKPLKNITFKNVYLELCGGIQEYKTEVPDIAPPYPEVYVYGRILPAKAIFFRYVDGLKIENFTVKTYREDKRETFVFNNVNGLEYVE